jgi:predicted kinase
MTKKVTLKKPTLIIGAGISATGKTMHLLRLAKIINNSFWIDKDTIEDTFLTRMDNKSKDITRYLSNLGVLPRKRSYHLKNVELQSYLLMLKEAKNNLLLGKHPIIDGNYIKELKAGYYEKVFLPFFDKIDCNIKIIYFHAPENVIKQRIIERREERDKDKLASENAWKSFLENEPIIIKNIEKLNHIKIDSTKKIDDNIRSIIKFLKR